MQIFLFDIKIYSTQLTLQPLAPSTAETALCRASFLYLLHREYSEGGIWAMNINHIQ